MKREDVRECSLSLPEATEEPHFHRTSFRVRGKIFVTAVPDEPFINVFVTDEVREPVLAMYPDWAEKLMWGKKAVGLRIDLAKADARIVQDLLRQAWEARAPKSLR